MIQIPDHLSSIQDLSELIMYTQRHDVWAWKIHEALCKIQKILLENGYIAEYYIDYIDKPVRVDFANLKYKHIIEFDGRSHRSRKSDLTDQWRDKRNSYFGWVTLRIRHICDTPSRDGNEFNYMKHPKYPKSKDL